MFIQRILNKKLIHTAYNNVAYHNNNTTLTTLNNVLLHNNILSIIQTQYNTHKTIHTHSIRLGHTSSDSTIKLWTSPADQPLPPPPSDVEININVVTLQGKRTTIKGKVGDTLLEAVRKTELWELIPAACNGGGNSEVAYGEGPQCRCCHVYVDPETLKKLPEKGDKEKDITQWLETATEYSRFSCEIAITEDIDNITIVVPEYRLYELESY